MTPGHAISRIDIGSSSRGHLAAVEKAETETRGGAAQQMIPCVAWLCYDGFFRALLAARLATAGLSGAFPVAAVATYLAEVLPLLALLPAV